MPRKNAIERSPEAVRKTIDGLIRKGQLTLDEMRAYVRDRHGEENTPSRSGLHRYTVQQEAMLEKMRGIDAAARVVVEELGESPDDRAGALLVQSITTLATDAALRAQAGENEPSIEEVRKLARAAKDVMGARRVSRQEREQIQRLARERLLAEQKEQLDKLGKAGRISPEALATIREQVYGITA